MKKLQYKVTVFYDLVNPDDPDYWDCQTEDSYFDTFTEAEAEARTHKKGDVEGFYPDGVECVVSDVVVEDEPEEVEYLD